MCLHLPDCGSLIMVRNTNSQNETITAHLILPSGLGEAPQAKTQKENKTKGYFQIIQEHMGLGWE